MDFTFSLRRQSGSPSDPTGINIAVVCVIRDSARAAAQFVFEPPRDCLCLGKDPAFPAGVPVGVRVQLELEAYS